MTFLVPNSSRTALTGIWLETPPSTSTLLLITVGVIGAYLAWIFALAPYQKDRILALDQRGELFLIHATPEKFELLDSRKISDQETWGHLAVVGDQVFIRELNGISAYRWR